MASIYKVASGWRVQIARRGVRKSRVFATKAAAEAWALREERAIIDGDARRWPAKTLGDALDKYGEEVSPRKGSVRAERNRLAAIRRDYPALSATIISDITAADLALWRDDRLRKVSPGSVQRDINLLRHVWTVSRNEWQWHGNEPFKALKMPGENPSRDRLLSWREIRRIVRRCGYRTGVYPVTGLQLVAYAALVALRTAMRASEVLSLTGETVDLARRIATLKTHKTSRIVGARQVPLTPQALRLLRVLHRDGPLIPMSASSLDALWRKARDSALVEDAHFHDTRGTALTHLSRRVDVLTLARISGHRDLSLLLNTYYRESSEQIAERMAKRAPKTGVTSTPTA